MAGFLGPASTELTTLVQSTAVDRRPVPLPRPRPKRLWLPATPAVRSDWESAETTRAEEQGTSRTRPSSARQCVILGYVEALRGRPTLWFRTFQVCPKDLAVSYWQA